MAFSMELRPRDRWALVERVEGQRPRTVKTYASMAECERALNTAVWRASPPVTDCGDDGCGECEVCERLHFLEWVGQVAGSIPHSVESNDRVDRYIAEKYPDCCDNGKVWNNADPTSGQWAPCDTHGEQS